MYLKTWDHNKSSRFISYYRVLSQKWKVAVAHRKYTMNYKLAWLQFGVLPCFPLQDSPTASIVWSLCNAVLSLSIIFHQLCGLVCWQVLRAKLAVSLVWLERFPLYQVCQVCIFVYCSVKGTLNYLCFLSIFTAWPLPSVVLLGCCVSCYISVHAACVSSLIVHRCLEVLAASIIWVCLFIAPPLVFSYPSTGNTHHSFQLFLKSRIGLFMCFSLIREPVSLCSFLLDACWFHNNRVKSPCSYDLTFPL